MSTDERRRRNSRRIKAAAEVVAVLWALAIFAVMFYAAIKAGGALYDGRYEEAQAWGLGLLVLMYANTHKGAKR